MSATPNQSRHCFTFFGFCIFGAAGLAVACAAGWLTASRLFAQDMGPTFRTRTELVRMDISITNKDGRPVGDVRPDEIEITESGRRRPIVLFRHLTDGGADRDARSGSFEEVSRNGIEPAGHMYVLVFDQLHIAPGHEQRARRAAERFLSAHLKPGDAVAIYGLPGPGPLVNLTTDLIHARATLQEVRGQAGRAVGGLNEFDAYRLARGGHGSEVMAPARPADVLGDMMTPPGAPAWGLENGAAGEVMRERASEIVAQSDAHGQMFLAELAGVMRKLRLIDGRKAFILFSEGFFIDNLAGRMEQVASAAAQSSSIVYAIDLNASSAATGGAAPFAAAERAARRDPLATLALETNGRLIMQAGSLDPILSQIAAETTDYYLVGFEPSEAQAPHDYHRVKVNVKRRGLVVRARTGYSTAPAASPIADREAIDVALAVPRTSSALPIEYTTYERSGPTPGKPRIIVSATARVPCSHLAGQSASMVFVVRDAVTGQAVASGTDRVALPESSDTAPGHLDPVNYAVQFDVLPGEYWMRMLVREPGGVIGTADRRFHVWSLDTAALSTSDLIVTRLEGPHFDPPSNATVCSNDDVLAYMEMYGMAASIQSADARVDILRAGSDEVVATAETIVRPGGRGEKIVRARLPVAGLAEGLYAARVRVLASNKVLRTVMRSFRIVTRDPHAR